MSAKKYREGLYGLDIEIGVFSLELDRLMKWGETAGFKETGDNTMPNGMHACHFFGGLSDFDKDSEWHMPTTGQTPVQKGKASTEHFVALASKIQTLAPIVYQKYASYESVIDCKRRKIGREAPSKKNSMFAAAACIKLERYEEAASFLDDAVRPGSLPFMKTVGEHLRRKIERNT